MYQDAFHCLSKIFNPTKKEKITYYKPLIWVEMNGRLGKFNFN